VEPEYVDVTVLRIGEMAMLDMLPGRFALGVRARRGRSVGGRGAGPGFMNWPDEYMLKPFVSHSSKHAKGCLIKNAFQW
jgi:hypothetical protein